MKPDLYTKAVLTVIAFLLVMIGCHQYVSPATTVKAEGPFANLQVAGEGPSELFFLIHVPGKHGSMTSVIVASLRS